MENSSPNETKAGRKLAEQDQRLANDLSEALAMMTVLRDDAEVQAVMAERGYDAAAVDEAITSLHAPAQAAYEARAAAMGKANEAQRMLDSATASERADFTDYRETARAIFRSAAEKLALGLNGKLPEDLQKFLTAAKASYGAGKKAPYAEPLARRGYSAARIDAELAGIKLVGDLAAGAARAGGAAQRTTKDRDAAAKALKAWVSEFRRIAKRALRGQGDLLAKLGL